MAKTYRNLFPQVYSFQNLLAAFHRARRGRAGREYVAEFEFFLEGNLLQLEEELRTETYRPGGYRSFYIYEPKKRLVSAAPFRDRVVHHALVGVLEPIWEARFIHDSYACRRGKGIHQAVDRAHALVRNYCYALKGDVVKFFPSVDYDILLGLLARHVADPPVLRLAARILESGAGVLDGEVEPAWFPGDDLFSPLRPKGLPIGNLTSQFWANVYLNELDQFVKRELGPRLPALCRRCSAL